MQVKWRKFITSVPLNNDIGTSRILDFLVKNILPTPDIGPWNVNNTIFTVNRKGVHTIYAGTRMETSSPESTGAMFINAGGDLFCRRIPANIDKVNVPDYLFWCIFWLT